MTTVDAGRLPPVRRRWQGRDPVIRLTVVALVAVAVALIVASHRTLEPTGRHRFVATPPGEAAEIEIESIHPFQAIESRSDATRAEVAGDGRTLFVAWTGSTCTRAAAVDVRRVDDRTLAVQVAEGVPLLQQFTHGCTFAGKFRATRVTLETPLPPGPVTLVPFASVREA